jgi:hypothetical protein
VQGYPAGGGWGFWGCVMPGSFIKAWSHWRGTLLGCRPAQVAGSCIAGRGAATACRGRKCRVQPPLRGEAFRRVAPLSLAPSEARGGHGLKL